MNFFPVFRDLFRGYSSAVFNEFFVKNQKVYKSANRVGRKNPGNLASLVKALKTSYLSSPNATHLVGKKMSLSNPNINLDNNLVISQCMPTAFCTGLKVSDSRLYGTPPDTIQSINQSRPVETLRGGGGDFSSKQNTASVKETTEENSILILILFNLNQGMQYN